MKLHEILHLPLAPHEAAAMYADPEYTEIRRRTLKATEAEASCEGDPSGAFTVRSELSMPTDRVPDMVRPFVGSTVTVHEEQRWSAPEPDGRRTGRMVLSVAGTPAGLEAALRMVPTGERTSDVEIDGELKAKVPLLGPKLEKAALPYVSTVLRAEERAAAAYRDAHTG